MTKKLIRKLLLVFIIIFSIVFLLTHYDKNEYSRDNLEAYVQKMCRLYKIPGLSAAIIDGTKEYYINYGNDNGKAIDENSFSELGSTTKAFTGLAIMQLEKEGKLKLTDSVSDYLPWFKPTYKKSICDITIEDLLCHTSGIPVWTITTIPVGTESDDNLLTKTIQNIKDVKLKSKPGTHYEYATINFDILALILEEVTGKKYEDFVTAKILNPLNMKSSFFRTNDECTEKLVQGYKTLFLGAHPYNAPSYYGNTAAGYLVTSTSDLMKWLKFWGKDASSSSDTLDLVPTVLNHDVSKSDNYFAGWYIHDDFIAHGGNNPNFCSQVIISRKKNQGVFVLSNMAGASATMIADGIYRILLGETVRSGLQLDFQSLADALSIIFVLLLIYLILLFWDKKTTKTNIVRITLSVIYILAALILPFVFHYPYSAMYVWLPFTVIIAIAFAAVIAVFELCKTGKRLRK